MSDDELRGDGDLRRRLQDIPAPSARIDADAVIAGAKRKRRPKTIALSSAATIAGVLVAPLVVPGLQQLQPASTTGESTDAGAAPESAPESGADGSESPVATDEGPAEQTDTGEGDQGASGGTASEAFCGLPRAGEIGLVLAFAEDPADGSAPVVVRTDDGAAVRDLVAVEVAGIAVTGGEAHVEAGSASEELALARGEAAVLTVTTGVIEPGTCSDGSPSAHTPVAILGRGTRTPIAVVGEPFDVR